MIGNFRLPISLTSGDTTAPPYVRQTDWLDIDSLVVDGDHKFVGLHAIFEYSNFVSLSASGAYTVDWGDGIVENYATGVQSYHQYDYNSSEFTGTESSRGYRQAIVTVTPQAGQILTNIDLNKKHNQVGLNNYSSGWLDVKISGASISSLFMSGTSVSSAILEQFSFIGLNAVTSMYQMFSGCSSLSSVPLFDTSSVTNMYRMFYQCSSLSSVPLFDTSSVTSMYQMFYQCSSLSSVPLFDTSLVTDMDYMFSGCSSLSSVPLFDTSLVTDMDYMFYQCSPLSSVPLFDTSSVTSMYRMFYRCLSLSSVPLFDTSSVTSMYQMFYQCLSLSSVPLFDTSSVTSMYQMFYQCSSLSSVPLFDTSSVTSMYRMFSGCSSLSSVPLFDTSSVTNMTQTFYQCSSLSKGALLGTSIGVDYDNAKLSAPTLVDVFNNLAIVTVATSIKITGNWGAPLLTPTEKAIATNKGWTIIE